MILEFFKMGGYGFYIWASFSIVTLSCVLLFLRTKKTLRKYEKEFADELEKLPAANKKRAINSSKVVSSVLASQNKLS